MPTIAENLASIRARVAAAAARSGRATTAVELLAVSKTFPPDAVAEASAAGQTLFGENRVQEFLAKQAILPPHLRWHFIGHLQANKVRKVLPVAEMIHSIDTLDLAQNVDRIAAEQRSVAQVLLEVNVAGEGTKFGFTPQALQASLEALYRLKNIHICGLMCIPPYHPNVESCRPHFQALRKLRDDLAQQGGKPLPQLSMGMSHDFEVAIEEGATLVRVGSAIFGGR
jgi:pyridoxal phosphate enzyme (YggS family)